MPVTRRGRSSVPIPFTTSAISGTVTNPQANGTEATTNNITNSSINSVADRITQPVIRQTTGATDNQHTTGSDVGSASHRIVSVSVTELTELIRQEVQRSQQPISVVPNQGLP